MSHEIRIGILVLLFSINGKNENFICLLYLVEK